MEDEELLKKAKENDEEAKNLLYEKYKYIIDILMKKYYSSQRELALDPHELEQEALYAFSDALNSFDKTKEVKLSTFITVCVDRRIKKMLKRYSGEKAKLLNSFYSLDYDYEEGLTLKDMISDESTDPLYNLTLKEDYQELVTKIESSLSPTELETFKLLKNGLDRSTIMLLTNRNEKQVDNVIQRLKNKIRDIIKD